MVPRTVVADLTVFATATVLRRGFFSAFLVVMERLLVPATALALFGASMALKVAAAFTLACVFTTRTFIQRSFAARTEADLLARTTGSVLRGDMLRLSVLPDEDARLELGQGVHHASTTIAQTLPNLVADTFASGLLALFVVTREPARVIALASCLTLVAAGALLYSRSVVERSVSRARGLQKKLYERFVDALDGRVEIVSSGVQKSFLAELELAARRWGSAGEKVAAAMVLAGRLPMLGIAAIVTIALATQIGLSGTLPLTIADVALFATISPAFAGIAQGVHGLLWAGPWVRAIAEVLRAERPERAGRGIAPAAPSRIVFEGVTFRYEGGTEDALQDVNFSWENERVVAVAGPNGSGKSTLLRLFLALAAPSRGSIRIDGTPLEEIDADSWRRGIAFLPQKPYLPWRADVRRAVRWPANEATDDAIRKALERVGLLTVLERMGADPLSVDAESLSVGQRQRIAIARLICRDARLVLLDEPDANLDRAGISLVVELVREMSNDRRVLVAAHTSELLASAERVLELSEGRVVG